MRNPYLLAGLIWLLPILSLQARQQPEHPHDAILEAARIHLTSEAAQLSGKARVELSPLDHRLRLHLCGEPLESFSPSGSNTKGKTTVGIRCASPKPWTLYVSGKVFIEAPVVVALQDLARNSVIGAGDVTLVERDTNELLRGYFDSLEQVIGQTLKRSLQRDQVVTPSLLVTRKTIQRGQKLTILAGGEGIEVRMRGKALRHGNPGDLIPVQNLATKKKLEARVVDQGLVRVD
jgi:flagella basal body P-ring formation protein FlgA